MVDSYPQYFLVVASLLDKVPMNKSGISGGYPVLNGVCLAFKKNSRGCSVGPICSLLCSKKWWGFPLSSHCGEILCSWCHG